MHYGVLGMKWGVRHPKQTNYKIGKVSGSGPTKDGKKYYEYNYSLSGKKRYADGHKGLNGFNGDSGIGYTRKEAKKNAQRNLVKALNKTLDKGDTEYESRQVKKFRNNVQKEAKKEYEKARKDYGAMDAAYWSSVQRSGFNSVASMKLLTLSTLAKQNYEQAGRNYVDLMTKEQKKKYSGLNEWATQNNKNNNRISDYQKKIKNAKTKDERELLQLESMDKLDELD